jgi:hypothetical protein
MPIEVIVAVMFYSPPEEYTDPVGRKGCIAQALQIP